MKTKFYGIIPARYASTRFEGKPLADIGGKPMIERVFENASQSEGLSKLVVATDDARIFAAVEGFGGNVVLTKESHPSGTDRVFEAASKIISEEDRQNAVVINIQGDEPFIDPKIIDVLCQAFDDDDTQIATLVRLFDNDRDLKSNTCMKVTTDVNSNALYFSRSVIPYIRSVDNNIPLCKQFKFQQHIGIYAYRYNVLAEITQMRPSLLEKTESLEQLRWLENGFKIKVKEVEYEGHSVDVPEDIERLKVRYPKYFNK